MNIVERIILIIIMSITTMFTRFLPFMIFSNKKQTSKLIKYFGYALPPTIFAMLVVYCFRNINLFEFSYGIPELLSIIVIIVLHLYKRQMLLSILGGTICYMLLVQFIII